MEIIRERVLATTGTNIVPDQRGFFHARPGSFSAVILVNVPVKANEKAFRCNRQVADTDTRIPIISGRQDIVDLIQLGGCKCGIVARETCIVRGTVLVHGCCIKLLVSTVEKQLVL